MQALSRDDILGSFVNSSRSRIRTVTFPPDFDSVRWAELDFFGWTDPRAPLRAYLIAQRAEHTVGIELRQADTDGSRSRSTMCTLCHAVHRAGGTSLFTARKAGAGGKAGNSIGTYMCSNFACSLYVRELAPLPGNQPDRALPTETRIRQLETRLGGFVRRVLDEQDP
ncbi:FBP domain-containing protein [Rhodococcus sp. CSLK01-03]|uniref:FBP domain-containing protein n=1 Tax=Rhodococcus indonesiensis TaxID=3055869 RepID=A0ABT7RKU4_9NOCA|nr:FBP domain-containing protein [Rhodococcus indonesiensis]MDM7487874.1 FBP domain-containing protein [Rhodococcus indonesiensis]